MKKLFLTLIFLFPFLSSAIYSKTNNDEPNVISYYAVGNTLDGQPLIESENLLRFYPVYKYREETSLIRVTVYYGGSVYTREANKKDDGRYWEVLLPNFNLGESIQRLDVETHFFIQDKKVKTFNELMERNQSELNKSFEEFINRISASKQGLETSINSLIDELNKKKDIISKTELIEANELCEDIKSKLSDDSNILQEINERLNMGISGVDTNLFSKQLKNNESKYDTIFKSLNDFTTKYNESNNELKKQLTEIGSSLKNFKSDLNNILSFNTESLKKQISELTEERLKLQKEYQNELIEAINSKLAGNTKQAGPGLTDADIRVNIENDTAFINVLYRNYKKELRQLVALDPAEKIGIFRLRYIPFPIIGNKLYKPFTSNSIAVFEVGIGFGNVPVSGDEFVKPTLSFDRLGVAFAISNKLFSDDAEVLALALTYDFNIYGSIGIGANFKTLDSDSDKVQPYYSFGINKKAFELLITALSKFFGIK